MSKINTLEPVWRHYRFFQPSSINPDIYSWLLEPDSLTKRLQQACGSAFNVRVLQQAWALPRASEVALLGLPQAQEAEIREVELCQGDQVWVSARSVFPKATLRGENASLQALESRPLGDILYSDATMERSEFELARLGPQHADYKRAVKRVSNPPRELWARRSVFWLHGKPLMVSEVFLPVVAASSTELAARESVSAE